MSLAEGVCTGMGAGHPPLALFGPATCRRRESHNPRRNGRTHVVRSEYRIFPSRTQAFLCPLFKLKDYLTNVDALSFFLPRSCNVLLAILHWAYLNMLAGCDTHALALLALYLPFEPSCIRGCACRMCFSGVRGAK